MLLERLDILGTIPGVVGLVRFRLCLELGSSCWMRPGVCDCALGYRNSESRMLHLV